MSVVTLKDAGLQAYYDSLFEMHGTEGWANFLVDVEYMEKSYNQVDAVDENNSLDFRRGQLNILRWLKGHKDLVERAHIALVEEETGVEPEATGGTAKVVE